MKKHLSLAIAFLIVAPLAIAQQWPQWGADARHSSALNVYGQSLNQNLVNLIYDPLAPEVMEEAGEQFGEPVLLAHYQAPLTDGDDVYMMFKAGTYDINNYRTQIWGETKYTWNASHTALTEVWRFESNWNSPGNLFNIWESVFHPALANGFLYVPGKRGSIIKVNKTTGTKVSTISPFKDEPDAKKIYTISPITVDAAGNLYYNVVHLAHHKNIFAEDVKGAWLVKVKPSDSYNTVSYSELTAGAPGPTDLCLGQFSETLLPWPPSPTAVPPSSTCGSQRPGFNIAPAVAPDGTIYVVSRAHFVNREAFMVAVKPNLKQKWIATLRNRFRDGCGVPVSVGGSLPPNGAPGGCRLGANYGVDPATNTYGGGRVIDDLTSSPTVAPDGSIYYGSFGRYNYLQGHMMRFSSTGEYLGAYPFGYDITPGIVQHPGGTYSVVTKDNRYGGRGSYCNNPAVCPADESGRVYPEGYFVTQFSPTLRADALADRGDKIMTAEWSYQNPNTQSCSRDENGNVTCVEDTDHPNGFEWCINAFSIDANGTLYANSEDGWLFRIQQGGIVNIAPGCGVTTFACGGKIFQQLQIGAAYTPTSIDGAGRILSQNAGHLFVAGN